jgi:hypothetical protein
MDEQRIAAAIDVLADEQRSLAVGLSKEAMDSTPGGSGVSFVDMAANTAGIRLAAVATRNPKSAHAKQARVRRGVEVADMLPSLTGLPEGITRDQLHVDHGGIGGTETRRLLGEIDRRIAALPLYRERYPARSPQGRAPPGREHLGARDRFRHGCPVSTRICS